MKLSLCLVNYAMHHEDMVNGGIAPPSLILALDEGRGVVSFIRQLLYRR